MKTKVPARITRASGQLHDGKSCGGKLMNDWKHHKNHPNSGEPAHPPNTGGDDGDGGGLLISTLALVALFAAMSGS